MNLMCQRIVSPITAAACLVGLALPDAVAVESELRLGTEQYLVDAELLNQYVDLGAVRHDGTTLRARGRGRWSGFGLEAEAHLALEADDDAGIEELETVEFRLRADYVAEFSGIGQLIPYVQRNFYTYDESGAHDPTWIGVEGWYMLPFEGLEAGGSINVDASGDYGYYIDIGARQLIQIAPLDLQAWQTINLGDDEFHEFTSGNDDSGFGVLTLGGLATVALPWQDTYVTMRAEFYGWLEDDDRDVVEDSVEFVIGIGFEWRPGD